ncbi:hypothetical protein [Streptomyces sp. NPDC058766]|uniref:hypothetical protein n=1 Tax=Streptomyces sp. NPDC058766 TaxID=3346630 RepID=UPI0036C0AB43
MEGRADRIRERRRSGSRAAGQQDERGAGRQGGDGHCSGEPGCTARHDITHYYADHHPASHFFPLRDPTPVYPHFLLWRADDAHPGLTALRDHLVATRPRPPEGELWRPSWAELTPGRAASPAV